MKNLLRLFFIAYICHGILACGGGGTPNISDSGKETPQQAAPVTFQPAAGVLNQDSPITLTSATSNANIFYTLDGSTPTRNSLLYSQAILLNGDGNRLDIRAIAIKPGVLNSEVTHAQYLLEYPESPQISASHPAGTYTEAITLVLTSEPADSEIHYTLDGSDPNGNSPLFPNQGIAIGVNNPQVQLKAVAIRNTNESSDIFSGIYIYSAINEPAATPTIANSEIELIISGPDGKSTGYIELLNPTDRALQWTIKSVAVEKSKEYREPEKRQQSTQKRSRFVEGDASKAVSPKRETAKQRIAKNAVFNASNIIAGRIIAKVQLSETAKLPEKHLSAGHIKVLLSEAQLQYFDAADVEKAEILINYSTRTNGRDKALLVVLTLAKKDHQTLIEALKHLNDSEHVIYAEPEYLLTSAENTPNDPDFSKSYNLQSSALDTAGPGVNATQAWQRGYRHTGNKSVLIGVFDTGIDFNHPDLQANIWQNPKEIPNNGIDDDNNGYIDDIHGWDFTADINNPTDYEVHGTHIAGIIASQGNNGLGTSGVMWDASMVALKINNGGLVVSDAIRAVEYAKSNGISIFNFSWVMDSYSESLREALVDAGLIVCAAGNFGRDNDLRPTYPANFDLPNIISVAASDKNGDLAGFSNYGKASVDLAAPGEDIYSTVTNGSYEYQSGTSMAAPHVVGVAGLMASYRNDLSIIEIKEAILSTVTPSENLQDKVMTGGRLDADAAMAAVELAWFQLDEQAGSTEAKSTSFIPFTIDSDAARAGEYVFNIELATDGIPQPLKAKIVISVSPCFAAEIVETNLDLGIARENTSTQSSVTVKNTCNAPLHLESVSSNDASGVFSLTKEVLLPPFSDKSVELSYTHSGEQLGEKRGVVEIVSTEGLSISTDYSVNNILGAKLSVSNITLNIDQPQNTQSRHQLTLSNIGDEPLEVDILGGPTAFDRNTNRAPIFNWQDISVTGTRLSDTDIFIRNGELDLSFSFPFYSKEYSQLYVGVKGYVSFEDSLDVLDGRKLPDEDVPAMIAQFWNAFSFSGYDDIFFEDFGDYAILQTYDYQSIFINLSVEHQLVLHDSGEFRFYYNEVEGFSRVASIGYQNANAEGVSLAYQEDYVTPQQAVKVIQNPWLSFENNTVTIQPGDSYIHSFTIDTNALNSGSYQGAFSLNHNGTNTLENRVLIDLSVE